MLFFWIQCFSKTFRYTNMSVEYWELPMSACLQAGINCLIAWCILQEGNAPPRLLSCYTINSTVSGHSRCMSRICSVIVVACGMNCAIWRTWIFLWHGISCQILPSTCNFSPLLTWQFALKQMQAISESWQLTDMLIISFQFEVCSVNVLVYHDAVIVYVVGFGAYWVRIKNA